uniref:Uncharacterized protein n=1 Tax=Vibrio parahaemolyticus TaxID=670 RepID=A0A1Y1BHE3_VIBPH|nr:hypothetical protein [Vibrio parahaemolyticus]
MVDKPWSRDRSRLIRTNKRLKHLEINKTFSKSLSTLIHSQLEIESEERIIFTWIIKKAK